MVKEGAAGPSHVHDLLSAALPAGIPPDELRPLVGLSAAYIGHPLDEDDPRRRMLDGQLAEAEGHLEEAAELYRAAAAGLDQSVKWLAGQRGTAHVRAARTLVALGRAEEARAHVEAAAGLLAQWGGWRVAELRAVERRLGLGPEPGGPASLTPREREVAALLAEGLTNSQLAERLYISPRTAAVHVSNILAKLGMSSRTEVAAWAAAGGLGAS
jgi:DNA-binding NarL/FixJ family response regulator